MVKDFWEGYVPEPQYLVNCVNHDCDKCKAAAQPAPVQEPIACGYDETTGNCTNNPCCYTTPPAAQRQWVGLTEDEIDEIFNNWPTYNLDHFEFAQVAVAKIFEKNLTTKVTVPDALNPKDENPAYAAGWNDCRAEMLKEKNNG